MGDDQDTQPLRLPVCSMCLRPVTHHAEVCLMRGDLARWSRHVYARAHYYSMSALERIAALAIGSAGRGATFHYWTGGRQ